MHDEQTNPESQETITIDLNYRQACLNLENNFFLPLRGRKVIANITKVKRGTPCDCEECEEAFLGLGLEEPK